MGRKQNRWWKEPFQPLSCSIIPASLCKGHTPLITKKTAEVQAYNREWSNKFFLTQFVSLQEKEWKKRNLKHHSLEWGDCLCLVHIFLHVASGYTWTAVALSAAQELGISFHYMLVNDVILNDGKKQQHVFTTVASLSLTSLICSSILWLLWLEAGNYLSVNWHW